MQVEKVVRILPEKSDFSGKSEILLTGIENFCDRIHDPPGFEPD